MSRLKGGGFQFRIGSRYLGVRVHGAPTPHDSSWDMALRSALPTVWRHLQGWSPHERNGTQKSYDFERPKTRYLC